jgi:hypothetical protein
MIDPGFRLHGIHGSYHRVPTDDEAGLGLFTIPEVARKAIRMTPDIPTTFTRTTESPSSGTTIACHSLIIVVESP